MIAWLVALADASLGAVQLMFYMLCGAVVVIIAGGVLWLVLSFTQPKFTKVIHRASLRKQSLAFIFKGSSLTKVVPCTVNHGYLTTIEKKPIHVPLPRPVYESVADAPSLPALIPLPENASDTKVKEIKEKNDVIQAQRDQISRDWMDAYMGNVELRKMEKELIRVHGFEGSPGLKTFFIYDGIGLAVNPETILGLDAEGDYRVIDLPEGSGYTMHNGGLPEKMHNLFIRVFLPINPEAVKKHLAKTIDQAILDGMYQDGVTEGMKTSTLDKDKKTLLYLLIAGIAIMGLIVVAAKLL
jgi:hypothetical protein